MRSNNEPVRIRYKDLANGTKSIYLDTYKSGKRSYEFLKLFNPAKRNVLDLKNETCKNREKRNVLKISRTRHFKTTKKQSRTGCFYSF